MPKRRSYSVVVESDQEGCFLRLPDGWAIEPEDSDVAIIPNHENGTYLVRPLIGDDGVPNCKFTFPENETA
jgi:hypothetical protein